MTMMPICGANVAGIAVGCGEPLVDPDDRYKCTDCDATFHKHCARRHFLRSTSAPVTYVAQPNGYGCAIACVAMIVGKTYDEMESWFLEQGLARDRMEKGIYDVLYFEALDRHGFSHVNRFAGCPFLNTRDPRPGWPPAPFAPIHICCADVAAGSHAVVMLADGSVLDPFKRERTSLAHPDYQRITRVVGVWRRP